jgi:hypothetical protein
MLTTPRRRLFTAAVAAPFVLAFVAVTAHAAPASGEGEGKLSIDVALPLSLLKAAGPDSNIKISCDGDDADSVAMIASLRRQGRHGVVRGHDDDGRWKATRHGDRFELRAWNQDDHQRFYLAIPWRLAECILGDGGGKDELTAHDLFGHHYEVRFEGDGGQIRFTLD